MLSLPQGSLREAVAPQHRAAPDLQRVPCLPLPRRQLQLVQLPNDNTAALREETLQLVRTPGGTTGAQLRGSQAGKCAER